MGIETAVNYGVAFLVVIMTFKVIIKPIMDSFLEKRRGNSNFNPCSQEEATRRMLKILEKKDNKDRPMIWGYCIEEAIEVLTKALEDLTEEIRRNRDETHPR